MKSKYILAWLCLFDGMFTWYFWTKGLVVETNPLMLKVLELGPILFLVVKGTATVAAACAGRIIWYRAPSLKWAYWLVVVVYVGVYVRLVLSA